MVRRRRGAGADQPADEPDHRVVVRLDAVLAERGMTLAQLAREVGVSPVNLSVLKNGHARAIRFSTLTAICDVLGCTPGDLLAIEAAGAAAAAAPPPARRPATPPPPRA